MSSFCKDGSLLSSTSLLQCQMNDRTVAHVVVSQRVGILDENTLKRNKKKQNNINNNKLINQHFILINADEIRHSNKAMSKFLPHTATFVFLPACL